MDDSRIDEIIASLTSIPHVTGVKRWTKAGKDRLYIETAKFNGGAGWNRGLGYAGMYLDIATGDLIRGESAGAKTADALVPTIDAIKAIRDAAWGRS